MNDVAFFSAESARLAALCDEMAVRFLRGGRLLAVGEESDARHVAVEFVHPVIVGKRALPALALPTAEALALEREEDDIVVVFDAGGVRVLDESFSPPTDDPFIRQELVETLYHVLWELVHVFLEHRDRSRVGAGAASFLYPFLEGDGVADLDAVREDVRRSIEAKAAEIGALREEVLRENESVLRDAAAALGPRVLALGNGGSATDAMDVVADLRARGRRALDLTDDPAVLTAIANDIGVEAIFARQVIAHGRAGDTLLTFSTSGSSANVIAALGEARRRGLSTIAMVGYDGGRIAAESLADFVVVVRSEHIPRIQEAQASAYHRLVELA
ncbi:D-sedoheptulose-7-phosphate isomerase [Solirubrobacter soli]|uniref:D-sedoheptulose-7-phosphate isomerase n=1 Tax=Solirubrobacter soli TaxID=363832 RepID=UPI00040E2455|nr:SIS domain-containing protein [Solirubrobacter soli]